ncbi:MAG TPA: NAD-glutamate dehydrogenase [Actinomycetota bacterium]|nr:NAD-glutamate dehydrogenase [Actinomycetota bacterium]
MAGTSPGSVHPPSSVHPTLQSLFERIEREAPERRDALLGFARSLTRRLSADDLGSLGTDQLYGLVRSAYAFADARGSRQLQVRVFDPTLDDDGYEATGSVVETNADDSPFLVDSVSEELAAREIGVVRLLHPVIGTMRDDAGRLERVTSGRDASHRESVMHFELDRVLADEDKEALRRRLERVLHDVHLVVRDFEPMQDRVRHMMQLARTGSVRYSPQEVGETVDFLEWLLQLNFVLLGYREYELLGSGDDRTIHAVPASGLGILSDVSTSTFAEPTPLTELLPDVRARIEDGDLLVISKTKSYSTVHRRARMDYIGVRKVAADGDIIGEARLIGLFTSKAYMEPAAKTPLLHHKLDQILTAEDLIPGSHDYKEVTELFESFPKDELFQASTEELRQLVVGLLALEKHGGIRVLVRRDLYARSVSIVVALPRERFSAELRRRLQAMFLERFGGSTIDYHLSLGETEQARIFFTVHVDPGHQIPEIPYEELEEEVERLSRTWDDDLLDVLVARVGRRRGTELASRYAARFPEYYKTAHTDWELTVDDVLRLEELSNDPDGVVVGIGNETTGERLTRVKLYKTGGKVDLSQFMPILESLGLRAVEEVPTGLLGDGKTYIHDFGVLDARGAVLNLETEADRVVDAITAMWDGRCEIDSLNRLVTFADLDWHEVEVLRSYRTYRSRVSSRFTSEYRNDAFAENPHIAARLVRLFQAKFDTSREGNDDEVAELRREILADLREVASLDQDGILRNVLGTIDATVRTNAYLEGRDYLSLKLRSEDVPEMPKPFPLFEIFVYSPRVEAIHLRGGMIARGGIRWSDRREDYRTEVLGLMKAQRVKNSVIVPDGSKGGFVLKRASMQPDGIRNEVTERYVTFMQGLLDITDNLVKGEAVHPDGVRVLDGPDPYLVVAADKGTATFSDIANGVSERYGFWLGDAFASGGSAGYDHKALGITARGAWESVKRHFRELGIDVTRDVFTVVGIGDMSGDVFGNGMLYTDRIRLVAAFDHRHVFIDPTPDPMVSATERRRLFELPRSSWGDYDRSLLSEGGDVVDRAAKAVTPSPQARAALGIPDDAPAEMQPNQLIRLILQAPVDLLWNGGIGTYVKHSKETNGDVGDRANDGVRVSGNQVRAKVVGEGGNLGFTQRGRIEYALARGRINTDFIDNSAGVDTSDHEVNLKILLGLAMQRGELTLAERNELLAASADDVVRAVLYDNYLQAQILSQEMLVSSQRIEAYEDLMRQLEGDGELDREVEFLPSPDEMAERRTNGGGMTRPELSVLLAYAKRRVYQDLVESELPDTPYLVRDLERYFPDVIAARFEHLLEDHPLKREIIAMLAANDVVNSQGITFVSRMQIETGASGADVVRAFRIARDVTGALARWDDVEALDGVIDPELQIELLNGVDWLVGSTSRWYLVQAAGQRLADAVESARDRFRELADVIDQIGPEAWRDEHEHETERLREAGVPEVVARRHAFQAELVHAPDIIAVSAATGRAPLEVARGFFLLGEKLEIDWLEHRLDELPVGTRWRRWAKQSMEDDLLAVRRALCELVLEQAGGAPIDEAVENFFDAHAEQVGRVQRFVRQLAVEGVTDLAQITVALRQVRALAG